MARNILTKRIEVLASQTGATLIDPTSGVGLVIDWIEVSTNTDVRAQVWYGSSQTDDNTIVDILRGGLSKDFRSPSRGSGLALPAGDVLKLTNGADIVKVVVGYHLDDNAV